MGKRTMRRGRWLTRGAAAALAAAVGLLGWNHLSPMLAEGSVTTYQAYTVRQGDLAVSMSFSAAISMKNAETFSAGSMTSVRELYVEESQEVRTGDKLAMLNNGEVFYAGFDGMVNEIRAGVGDTVRPGGTVLQVCDIENLQVSMNVDEYDIANVRVGQRCEVTVIALGVTFETSIRHINYVSGSMGSVAYYTATMDAAVPDSVLPGMQATVTIPAQSVEGVPVLSMEALAFDGDGAAYVLVRNAGGEYERQMVETGLNDGMDVQITAGLDVGDEVWAVSGTQSVEPAFSLAGLYKRIVGETVVIHDRSGRAGRSGGRGRSGEASEGAEEAEVPESAELPEGMMLPESVELPEGMALSEGMTLPEGAELPEGVTLPIGMPSTEAANQPEDVEQPEAIMLSEDIPLPANPLPESITPPANTEDSAQRPNRTPSAQNEAGNSLTSRPDSTDEREAAERTASPRSAQNRPAAADETKDEPSSSTNGGQEP